MNMFSIWNPSDAALILGFNILWQVTLILAVALMFASAMHRSPSVRYWVLCASLAMILLSPLSAILMQSAGGGWLSIVLTREVTDPKIESSAVVAKNFQAEGTSSGSNQPSRPTEGERTEGAPHRHLESMNSGHFNQREPSIQSAEIKMSVEQVASSPVIVNREAPEDVSGARRSPTWLGVTVRTFGPWVLCIWSVGSVLMMLRLARGYFRLVAILRSAKRNFESELKRSFEEAGQSLGLAATTEVSNHMPKLLLSDQISGPIAAGIIRPCVVLPERMVDRITSEQLRDILVHEMAHVIRRDPIVALMQNFVAAFFWLHPLVRVLNRQLSQAREEVCDNYVLAATDAPSYSRTLLSLAELVQRTSPIPGTVGLFTSRWKLEQRIAGLLDTRRNRGTKLSLVGCMFVAVTSLALVAIASIGTLRMVVAQAVEPAEKSESGNDSKNSETDSPDHKSLSFHGHVIGPDGKPTSAELWIGGPPRVKSGSPQPQAVEWTHVSQVGQDGKFEVQLDRSKWNNDISNHPESAVRFIATANGYGHAWADVKLNSAENEITLQLVRDHPIDGRILTTDGRPAVGVKVAVTRLYRQINVSDDDTNPGSKMASAEMIAKTASNHSGTYTLYPEWPGQGPTSKPVFTDNDGRFRLEGLGAGSMVSLEASGGGIGAMRLGIHNIPAPTDAKNDGMIAVREGLGESEYFAKFTHIAVPGRTIRGVVTDAVTERPIEGVQVWVESSWPSRQTPASTDRDGRYELTGVQKAKEYQINLDPKTSLNFNKTRTLLDPSGLDPIECNLSLEQGIQYRGHVTDSETGKAVKGVVVYNPLYLSEDAIRLGEEYQKAPASSTKIMEDGSYEIPVLPGPGAIGVQVAGKGYLSASVDLDRAKEIVGQHRFKMGAKDEVQHIQISAGKDLGGTMNVARYQGIAIVSPSENALPVVVDFKLTRSRSRPGIILDDAAKPLTGSHAIAPIGLGVTGQSGTDAPLHTSEFLVDGLSPGNARTLLFLHPERELGAKVVVTGDEMTPFKVSMTKTGAIKGRFVDKFGKPLTVVYVSLIPSEPFLQTQYWTATVDEDGRFRINGLIQGCTYSMRASIPDQRLARFVKEFESPAFGETLDLGEFTPEDKFRFMPVLFSTNQ